MEKPGKSIFFYFDDPLNDIEEIFLKLLRYNISSIFYIAKNYDGYVSYKSESAEMKHNGLEILIYYGKKYKIKIYVILMVLNEGYSGKFGSGGISAFFLKNKNFAVCNERQISILENPINNDRGNSYYVCPSNTEVWDRLFNIMMELKELPIQGIHLDCIRYPIHENYCFCDNCRKLFYQKNEIDLYNSSEVLFNEFRCELITIGVNKTISRLKTSGFKKTISALVWRYPEAIRYGQEWINWNVDFVTPMYYSDYYLYYPKWILKNIQNDVRKFKKMNIIPAIGGDIKIIPRRHYMRLIRSKKNKSYLLGHYNTKDFLAKIDNVNLGLDLYKKVFFFLNALKRNLKNGFF